ncbi:hypothetical protein EWM64_g3565 [Hericium alpestre]|uniref:Uncharacterized protein n=1 Tax=Hericium alpestre TaxID=135208 RepID=A0A4Y9ZZZ4_9AGAM|nr:hypothetical protein EWM64_g3565 [Hericium alpestre]
MLMHSQPSMLRRSRSSFSEGGHKILLPPGAARHVRQHLADSGSTIGGSNSTGGTSDPALKIRKDAALSLQYARAQHDVRLVERTLTELKLEECRLGLLLYSNELLAASQHFLDAELHVRKLRAVIHQSGLGINVGVPSDPLEEPQGHAFRDSEANMAGDMLDDQDDELEGQSNEGLDGENQEFRARASSEI